MKSIVIVLIIMGLLVGLWFFKLKNNFHEVLPGRVYRSAQPDAQELKEYVRQYAIKTVINLRGPNPGKRWYIDELQTVKDLGITYHEINLTSSLLPRVDQLLDLIDLLQQVPRPLLLHCKLGADRSGLASVLVLLLQGDKELPVIREQLSWRYMIIKADSTGKQFLRAYEKWLKNHNKLHNEKTFSQWVKNHYIDSNGNIYYLVAPINNQLWERPDGKYADGHVFSINRADTKELRISGWAFDVRNQGLLAGVDVFLGQIALENSRYGIYQPELLQDFGNKGYLNSGWEAKLDTGQLTDGCYDLVLRFVRLDGSFWKPEPQGKVCIQ